MALSACDEGGQPLRLGEKRGERLRERLGDRGPRRPGVTTSSKRARQYRGIDPTRLRADRHARSGDGLLEQDGDLGLAGLAEEIDDALRFLGRRPGRGQVIGLERGPDGAAVRARLEPRKNAPEETQLPLRLRAVDP